MSSKQHYKSREDDYTAAETYLADIRNYGGIISRICFYYAKDAEDFKDLRQDVLASIWESRDRYRAESSKSTWIYRITLNTCISDFRNRKRKGEKISLESLPEPAADDGNDVIRQHEELYRLIRCLPSQDKALLLLWLDDMKYEEISEIMDCPRNTIATRLRRIKEKLIKLSNK